MHVLISLSFWFAVMMPSCCGDVESQEEETATEYFDYWTMTPAYDYDYNMTFEYDNVIETSTPTMVLNKASQIGQISQVLLLGLAVHQIGN